MLLSGESCVSRFNLSLGSRDGKPGGVCVYAQYHHPCKARSYAAKARVAVNAVVIPGYEYIYAGVSRYEYIYAGDSRYEYIYHVQASAGR